MIPTPSPPTTTAHPEISPGVWTWTAASQPVPPHPTPSQSPTPEREMSLAVGAGLFLSCIAAVGGFVLYQAGVNAGESGSAAKVAALESQADATNARIESFCQGAQ